jgi:hypothetical protein
MKAKDETVFTAASTNHGNNENGGQPPPLISAEGRKLASKSGPTNAFKIQMGSSGVDNAMRGSKP